MSVNKVILIGNVGKNPEVRYFDNGSSVAQFTLATTERGYTAANGTQIPDRTEWHNIVCWRGLAKIAEQFVKKGSQIYIEGKIRTRSYDDANKTKRYVVEIYADNLELLGKSKNESDNLDKDTSKPKDAFFSEKDMQSGRGAMLPDIGDNVDDLPF